MKDPPAPIVPLAQVIFVVLPVIEARFPEAQPHEDLGISLVGKPLQPVWCREAHYHAHKCQAREDQPENSDGPLRPRKRHFIFEVCDRGSMTQTTFLSGESTTYR